MTENARLFLGIDMPVGLCALDHGDEDAAGEIVLSARRLRRRERAVGGGGPARPDPIRPVPGRAEPRRAARLRCDVARRYMPAPRSRRGRPA